MRFAGGPPFQLCDDDTRDKELIPPAAERTSETKTGALKGPPYGCLERS